MGLQEQHVAFKFAGGVETKMDSKAVPGARLLVLENGVFTRAISIKKRNGYEALSKAIDGTVDLISGARRLASRDNELLLFTAAQCYSKQTGADQWTDVGALLAPTGFDRAAVHTGTAQTLPDRATKDGVTAYAWEDSRGGVWWTAVDAENGKIYRAPEQANADGQRPRCVAVGDNILILYAVPVQHRVCAIVVNPSMPTAAVSETIVVEDLDLDNPCYDAVPTARTGEPALMVWHEYATTNLRIGYITGAGQIGSPASGHPSAYRMEVALDTDSPIACAFKYVDGANADQLYVVAMSKIVGDPVQEDGAVFTLNGGAVSTAIAITDTDSAYTDADDVQRIALVEADGMVWAVFEENATEGSEHYCVVNSVTGGVAGTERTIRGLSLVSRAFQAGDDADTFAVFMHDTTYFNVYLTLRLSDFAPTGRHLPGSACAPTRGHVSAVYVESDIATLALPYKTRIQSENNDKFGESAVRVITMDFDSEDSHQTAQFGRGLYLAGACPQHYDALRWTEQGFHMGPELVEAASTGAGDVPAGTHGYKVWYEWPDSLGEIHRGPESPAVLIATGGSVQVTVTVPTLRVTRKENVRICVARSLVGDASRYFRVSSLDPTTEGDVNGYIANDTTIDSIDFIDEMSDDDLEEQEELYTTGGILSNDPAPLGSHVVAGKNRLFYTDAEAGSVVRFSKRIATGFGAEFAPELAHDVDPAGGDITALATMDDVIFAFKASAIFAFNGDGPGEDGTNFGNFQNTLVQGFSSSQLITSDVGCTDPSSIVLTPLGLMFKSAKGIYQIDRSRQVTYVGAPVEAYNTQSVRRGAVVPDRTGVLFLTDDGLSLYYDYLFQQWSTFTNHEGNDAAVVDNTLHYLRTNDVVYRETIDQHSDAGTHIRFRLETAWLHLTEHLQGFQRFWKLLLLGTRSSPHQLGISHRINYDEAWSEPYWLDATGDTDSTGWLTGDSANLIGEDPVTGSVYGEGDYGEGPYGGTGPDVYQWRYGIHENGQSVQLRFEDFEKASLDGGASFELTEMTLTGGVKKPDFRPFSAARST